MKRFFSGKRTYSGIFAVCALAVSFLLDGCGQNGAAVHQSVDTAMGTVVQQSIYGAHGEEDAGEILSLIRELEEGTLSWRLESSEIWRIDQSAGDPAGVRLSGGTASLLRRCLEMTEASGGAFDVTLGAAARLWDIDAWASGSRSGQFRPPDREELKEALSHCGPDKVRLEETQASEDRAEGAQLYLAEGTALDLGAVGKGIALDRIRDYLETKGGVDGAVISLGGSVLTYGAKPDGTAWKVGIADPADPSRTLGMITLEGDWCISTSGDYERYVEADGVRYHHILDPSTGYPADSGLSAVTVLTGDGFLSDALSTACFVLGKEQGAELASRYGAEALFVGKDGSITMTEGMEGLFQAM